MADIGDLTYGGCRWAEQACPICNSPLVTDGKIVWCSHIGNDTQPTCDYGVYEKIPFKLNEEKQNG